MRLVEFQGQTSRQPAAVASELSRSLGKLVRIGGSNRIYEVGTDELAVVYSIDGTLRAFALSWSRSLKAVGVSRIYVWKTFRLDQSADFYLDLPTTGDFEKMLPQIVDFIKNPKAGAIVEEDLNEQELDEARRTTDQEFIKMATARFPDRANKLSMSDLMAVAQENDVQIPTSIRQNPNLKIDAHHWNLSGESAASDDKEKLGAALGAPIEEPETTDPAYLDALNLAKAKTVRRMAAQGKLYLMGRKANGAFMRMPGVEEVTAQLERMLSRQLEAGTTGRHNMEEQYDMLRDKVKLVAGGEAVNIKSLLITGAPSSGKTFTVLETIKKELGLKEGPDFVIKKGRITTIAMYRTLIENIDGLVIFDDCDSVVEDKNAINMLKGALDTDAVREISYDVRGTINTSIMAPEKRDEIVNAISRILRGTPQPGDVDRFEHLLKKKKKSREDDEDEYFADEDDDFEDPDAYDPRLHEVQQYLSHHLPNKIDFKGRIIFISNMDESEWDSAILTRAFTVNMNFTSEEMIDFIDKIKGRLKSNISPEEQEEVMEYIRELYTTGKLKRQVNFRLVQQAFDLRLTSNWKKLIAML